MKMCTDQSDCKMMCLVKFWKFCMTVTAEIKYCFTQTVDSTTHVVDSLYFARQAAAKAQWSV